MADALAAAHAAIADASATPREKLLACGVIALMEDAGKLVALAVADRDELHEAARAVVISRRDEIQHTRGETPMVLLDRLVARLDEQKERLRR